MSRTLLLLAALLAAAAPARAETSPRDVALLVTTETLLVVDVATTILALEQPDTRERNPILGPRPPPARVIVYGAACGLVLAGLFAELPARLRWIPPVAVGVVESLAVGGNLAVRF